MESFFLSQNKDLQDESKYYKNGEKSSLSFILKDLTGYDMGNEEDMTMSDWEAEQLSEKQVRYACIVAYASYRIGKPQYAEKNVHEEEPCKLELVSTEVENQKSRKEFSVETSCDGNYELAACMEEEHEVGTEREEIKKDEQDEVMETDAKLEGGPTNADEAKI